jgi:hypothetical protein
MAVARKSAAQQSRKPQTSPKKSLRATNPAVIPMPVPQPQSKAQIPVMSPRNPTPLWLLHLCKVQRYSAVVTFLLVTATLFVYGWTVYSQQRWSQAYRQLQHLQLQERQLTTTNEMLKNQMALQAGKPGTSLVSPSPSTAIFLQTPTEGHSPQTPATTTDATSVPTPPKNLGY